MGRKKKKQMKPWCWYVLICFYFASFNEETRTQSMVSIPAIKCSLLETLWAYFKLF